MASDSDIIQFELAFQKRNKEKHLLLYPIIMSWLEHRHFQSFDLVLERLNYYRYESSSITHKDIKDIQQLFQSLKKKESQQITAQEYLVLGLVYDYGLGINQLNQTEALIHYQHAADRGVVPAVHLLGNLTHQMDGNDANATIYWTSAAQKNFAISLTQLGDIAIKSSDLGVQKQAVSFYESAAFYGDREGYMGLSNYHLYISKDYQLARKFAEDAAKKGCLSALSNLKVIYEKGLGVNPNGELARFYFELLLKQAPIKQYDLKNLIQQFLMNVSYIHNNKTYTESLPEWVLEDEQNEKERKVRKGLCSGYVFMLFRAAMIGDSDSFLKRLSLVLFLDDRIILMGQLYSRYRLERENIAESSRPILKKALSTCSIQTEIVKATENHQQWIEQQTLQKLKLDDEHIELLDIAKDLYIFISSLLYSQKPEKIPVKENGKCITQSDIIELLKALPPDQLFKKDNAQIDLKSDNETPILLQTVNHLDISSVKETFNFAFVFINDAELNDVIDRSILIGDMVVVVNGAHKIYFSYSKAGYFLYDPSAENFLMMSSSQELVFFIKYFFYTRLGHDDNYVAIGIKAYSCIQSIKARPTEIQLIEEILQKRGNNTHLAAKDCHNTSSLYIAIYNGSDLVAAELLRRGVKSDEKVVSGWTSAHIAAWFGNVTAIKLIAGNQADLNCVDINGKTPLYFALIPGHLNVIEVLADKNCDFTVVNHQNKSSALHNAIFFNHIDVASFLTQKFPELFKKIDGDDQSPMQIAVSQNNLNMIIYILSLVKNLNIFSTNDIDLLKPLREKLVDFFIEGLTTKRDLQQKLIVIDAVLNKENALGHLFHMPTNSFLYTFSLKKHTGCIEKIKLYRNELVAEINPSNAFASSTEVKKPSPFLPNI